MKSFIFLIPFLLSSCAAFDKNLQKAVSYGDIIVLNKYSDGVDKNLFIRMLSFPEYEEGCFKETNGACYNRYFLAVSTFDEEPETNIYLLKSKGEVIDIVWHETTKNDMADITIIMNNHTSLAFENNPGLKKEKVLIRINLTAESMNERIKTKGYL